MSAGRIYWGQIITVLGVLALGLQIAVQWTAAKLGYQAALGDPNWVVFHTPVYAPWRFFIWWFQYDHYARSVFETGSGIILIGAIVSVISAFGFSVWRARGEKHARTYGTARWATDKDVNKLKLTEGDGVILGSWKNRLLRHDGDEHVLVIAPTNTGKSVGIALPTGLIWRDSYIALDLKGEHWAVTSGVRSAFGPVFRFAPSSEQTHRYNPLTQIRRGPMEIRDAQLLADMLVDPEGSLRERSHWQLRAFELLVAVMLWTLYAEKQKTLARIAELLADPTRPISALLDDMLEQPIKDGQPHPVVAAGARQLLNMAEAERSGVISTALGYLALFRDPLLAAATAESDFIISDLINGDAPVSLYFIVPPEEISRLKPLLRLIFNQTLKRLTETAGAAREPGRRVLLMLDEFCQLGRLDFFEHALAYIRGYRIKACLVAQSLNQIAQAYGENSAILDNAHIRVAFACNDERTAKRISDMLGATTETRNQMNYAGSRMSPWLGHAMVSRQEAPRPLMTSGEVMQMHPDDSLILVGGAPPIKAKKVRYFTERAFLDRVRPAIEIVAPTGSGKPSDWDGMAAGPRPTAGPEAPKKTTSPKIPPRQLAQHSLDFTREPSRDPANTPEVEQTPAPVDANHPGAGPKESRTPADSAARARTLFAFDDEQHKHEREI